MAPNLALITTGVLAVAGLLVTPTVARFDVSRTRSCLRWVPSGATAVRKSKGRSLFACFRYSYVVLLSPIGYNLEF